jgi:hypothetical protein
MKFIILFTLLLTIGFTCQQRIANSKAKVYIHPSIIDANKLGIHDKSNQISFYDYDGGFSGVLLEVPNGKVAQKEGDSVYVSAFYIDATEVCNLHYRAFLKWNYRIYQSMPKVPARLLPDTSIWLKSFPTEAIGGLLKDNYFRDAAFDYYPVVGVSWQQAQAYALWRTDRINEAILIYRKIIRSDFERQHGANHFNTYNFLNRLYEADAGTKPIINDYGEGRHVLATDDILLPNYRLPTASELKQAAKEVKDYRNNKALKVFIKKIQDHTKAYPKPAYYDQEQYPLPYSIIEQGTTKAPYHVGKNDPTDEWTQETYNTNEQYNMSYYRGMDADGKPNYYTPIWVEETDSSIVNTFAKKHTTKGPYQGFRCVMSNLW